MIRRLYRWVRLHAYLVPLAVAVALYVHLAWHWGWLG